MEFDYVVKRREKAKICFGSGLERKTLESDVKGLFSRHARTNMMENIETIMPGKYDMPKFNSAMGSILYRPTSLLGTVMGGRTAARKDISTSIAPAPGTYDIRSTFPEISRTNCAPFNVGSERKMHQIPNTPGVGQYYGKHPECPRVRFAYSFGGKKTVLPVVRTKCEPFPSDTCERCGNSPEGDYWYLDYMKVKKPKTRKEKRKSDQSQNDDIFLCRPCYNIEKMENKIFNAGQIRAFQKIRDCSKIHFHDGCRGKVYLVPPDEIKKLSVREGYLSIFYQ